MFYVDVIGIPLVVGIIFRLIFIKKEKGFYATISALTVTVAFIVNAVVFYATGHWGDGGSEGPALLALAAIIAFFGTATVESFRRIYIKYKN